MAHRRRRRSLLAALAACAAALWGATAGAQGRGDAKLACAAAADRGQSLRDGGSYREARRAFARCAEDDCPRIVARACGDWLRDLDAATPTVVLGAKDARGADVTDVRVELDGAPFATALDGHPQAADPGPHRLRFTARDGAAAEAPVTLRAGEKNRVVLVTLAGGASEPAVAGDVAPAGPSSASPRLAVGLTLTALAVASGAAGAYFVAQSQHQADVAAGLRAPLSPSACAGAGSPACASLSDAVDAQHRDARLGAAALVGAGAFALGAIATWVLWRPARDADRAAWVLSPAIAPRGAALGIGRVF